MNQTKTSIPITGVHLRGGENEIIVALEIDNRWVDIIKEYVPTQGNDGSVWPISHIVEVDGIKTAVEKQD